MDLKATLDLLQQTAQEAKRPKVQRLDAVRNPHELRTILPDGTLDVLEQDAPARMHTVYDIESLGKWADGNGSAKVWHCDSEVVLVLDDANYRENTVTLPLPIHPKFTAIENGTNARFSQKALIDFLRLNLKEEIEAASPGLVASLRKLKFRRSDSGTSEVAVGRESMGRDIEELVTGLGDFPEELTLTVPIWLHLDLVVKVELAFDVDASTCEFIFRPKPGAIQQAKVNAQEWLHNQLESECGDCTVYFGRP